MALEGILEKLQEERDRLTKELNRVVKMIKAAGRGAQAAVQEYGRRTKKRGVRAKAVATTKPIRTLSTATLRKMKAAQRARRQREKAKPAKAPKKGQAGQT